MTEICIDQGSIAASALFAFLLIVSEFLPFIKTVDSNGIIHTIVKKISKGPTEPTGDNLV